MFVDFYDLSKEMEMKRILNNTVREIKKAVRDLDKHGVALGAGGKAMTKEQFLTKFFPFGLSWGANRGSVVSQLLDVDGCRRYFFYNFVDYSAGVVVSDLSTGRDVRDSSKEVVEAIASLLSHLQIYQSGRRL